MKRRLILHGALKQAYPQPIEIEAETAQEALIALGVVTGKALKPTPDRGRFVVQIPGFTSEADYLSPLSPDQTDLHIAPVFSGGGGNTMQIVMGVVLIAVAIVTFQYELLAPATALMIGTMGAMMLLGGILAAISKAPTQDQTGSQSSLYLGTPQNTTAIGTRISIIYGTMRTYGQLLSADIEATDVPLNATY